jgi:hypothetical protein
MPFEGVKITGLRELDRAFKTISKDLQQGLRAEMKDAAEPVRLRAEQLAESRIRNATGPWTRMKSGVTTRGAYIAPSARRRGGSPRPNYGGLLMSRAMVPAAEQKRDEVVDRLERWIDRITDDEGF